MNEMPRRTEARGFTIIELLIVVMIVAIGVALATPTYQDAIQKRHTESRSERFASFVNHAQSESIKRFQTVTVNVNWTAAKDWCVGAVEGEMACDCTGLDADNLCVIDSETYVLASEAGFKSGLLDPGVAGNGVTFTFDPTRGIMSNANNSLGLDHAFVFRSDNAHFEATIDVLPTSRIAICSSGNYPLTSYDACR